MKLWCERWEAALEMKQDSAFYRQATLFQTCRGRYIRTYVYKQSWNRHQRLRSFGPRSNVEGCSIVESIIKGEHCGRRAAEGNGDGSIITYRLPYSRAMCCVNINALPSSGVFPAIRYRAFISQLVIYDITVPLVRNNTRFCLRHFQSISSFFLLF